MTDLTFATATPDGVPDIGAWLYETAPEIFAYLFAGRGNAERALARFWAKDNGFFSHRLATLALRDGAVVGLEQGYVPAQRDALRAATNAHFQAEFSNEELAAQVRRGAYTRRLIVETPPGAYYVQHLVTAPAARGSGAGKALLQRAFERARAQGQAAVHLDVEMSNPARAFYVALGMEPALELRVPYLAERHGVSGVVRMIKTL
jgi:ribosomal protein S18 acetylase RimI-like enzyme